MPPMHKPIAACTSRDGNREHVGGIRMEIPMTKNAEINRLKFELQMVQNEINRRHLHPRVDVTEPFKAMSALQSRKSKIQQQLAALRTGAAL